MFVRVVCVLRCVCVLCGCCVCVVSVLCLCCVREKDVCNSDVCEREKNVDKSCVCLEKCVGIRERTVFVRVIREGEREGCL